MKKLQVKINNEWKYVFCRNERTGLILAENPANAIHGDKESLKYFQTKFNGHEFRITK